MFVNGLFIKLLLYLTRLETLYTSHPRAMNHWLVSSGTEIASVQFRACSTIDTPSCWFTVIPLPQHHFPPSCGNSKDSGGTTATQEDDVDWRRQ